MINKYLPGLLLLIFPVIILFSCSSESDKMEKEKEMRYIKQYLDINNITVEPQKSGLYFINAVDGDGLKPERTNWVILRYTVSTIWDIVVETTDEKTARDHGLFNGSSLYGDKRMPINALTVNGVIEGLQLMKEGGRATLIIPSHLAYGTAGIGLIPPYTTLVYDIELSKVISDPVVFEKSLIDNYIALYSDSTHLLVQEKDNGLYYIETYEGTGSTYPQNTDQVSLFYKGSLTDGRVFDSRTGGTPFEFNIGMNATISGFEEGVKMMRKGGKSRIVIPSALAYGTAGTGSNIPGYTPLVFELELIDIVSESPDAGPL